MKRILVAALLLGCVGAYIKFVEFPQIKQGEDNKKLFGSVASSEIQSIQVINGTETIDLVNKDPKPVSEVDPSEGGFSGDDPVAHSVGENTVTSWSYKDAPSAILDRARVEALASAVATATSDQTVKKEDQGDDLSLYGLDKPELVISITANGQTKKVSFGKKNEFVAARYAKADGTDDLYLVNETLFEAASKKSADFRSKTPISFGDNDVKQIAVTGNGEPLVTIDPTPEKTFKIVQPIKAAAQSYTVFDLYRNLRNLQAENFIDKPESDLTAYGLAKPAAEVLITTKSSPLTITFGAVNNGEKEFFQINKQGTVYQAVGHPLAGIQRSAQNYRDPQQFKFDSYVVSKFVVEKQNSPYAVLVKKKDKAKETFTLNDQDADAPFVRQYFRDVAEVRADSFLPIENGVASITPFYKITVSTDDGQAQKEIVLTIGQKVGETYPAFVSTYNEPFTLTQENVDILVPPLEKFKPVVEPTATHVANP